MKLFLMLLICWNESLNFVMDLLYCSTVLKTLAECEDHIIQPVIKNTTSTRKLVMGADETNLEDRS